MKSISLISLSLLLALGPTLLWAADPVDTQPSPAAIYNPNPMIGGTIKVPPENWTRMMGTLQTANPTAQIVQIKDVWGKLFQVQLDKQVTIEKDGKPVQLAQVQPGDVITLVRRKKSVS